ncbi:MAG: succinate dehydrogenase, cytochrome b556 subunit [Burkholderiales bacterium]|nr:MAG: succinate dehydrogenase, cytochrome b556 subunit [Burkholderiales bacterium]
MTDLVSKSRPQYRNIDVTQLAGYRLPPAGILSILHRISGALMFLVGLPFVLYLWQESLTSELSFQNYRAIASHWFAKLVLLALVWAFLHHLFAGIRYLALDVHVGLEKQQANTSALVVFGASLAVTALAALKLFGAF